MSRMACNRRVSATQRGLRLGVVALPVALVLALAPTASATSGAHLIAVENNEAMAACELAYDTATLIEDSNTESYGAAVTPQAIHNIVPQLPLKPTSAGVAWLTSASLRPNGGNFTYHIRVASTDGYAFTLTVVNAFEQLYAMKTTGTWLGPHGKTGTWSKNGSGFVMAGNP